MSIKPLGDTVILARIDPPSETQGGLYIPDAARGETKNEGWPCIVLAVGPGTMDDDGRVWPVAVSPGQRVLVTHWGSQTTTMDGREVLVTREERILGVIEDEDE